MKLEGTNVPGCWAVCFGNCSLKLEERTAVILRVMSPVNSLKTLKMKAGYFFETPAANYQTTQRNNAAALLPPKLRDASLKSLLSHC